MLSRFLVTPVLIFSLTVVADDHAKSAAAPAAHAAHGSAKSVDADQALKWLKNGNTRFIKNKLRRDGRTMNDVKRLEKGQNPHTIILSCSDSRVPPEHIFDQALGEIFVVRVAGEALDQSVIASIEYAVEHLGTKNIVVMGHNYCGAVKAAVAAKTGESSGSPSLDALVADIKPRLPASTGDADVAKESSKNAQGVATDLLNRSKIISEKIQHGDVKIRSSLYHLEDGHVEWF